MAVLSGSSRTAAGAETGHEVIPLIVMDNVPLLDAIKNLARQAGGNYIIDLRVAGAPLPWVSGRWTNSSADAALQQLLKQYKLSLVTNPATTVARIAPTILGVKPVLVSQVGANIGAVLPLLVMDELPLTEAITNLAEAAKLKLTLDPKWSESAKQGPWTVSFRWEKITARQALVALLDNYDLMLVEEDAAASARVVAKRLHGTSTTGKRDAEPKQP